MIGILIIEKYFTMNKANKGKLRFETFFLKNTNVNLLSQEETSGSLQGQRTISFGDHEVIGEIFHKVSVSFGLLVTGRVKEFVKNVCRRGKFIHYTLHISLL